MDLFLANFFDVPGLMRVYPYLLQGLLMTMQLALVALPLSLLTGLLVAVAYSFGSPLMRRVLIVLIDFLRAFPVLVLLIWIYYSLPFLGLTLGAFTAVVVAVVLNNTGYFGEIFRSGIESIPRGQYDAAAALGLRPLKTMVLIILPQALRNVFPPLASNALELVKTTSIASLVALPELIRTARIAQEQTYNPTPLVAVAVLFLVMLGPFSIGIAMLERRILLQQTRTRK